MRKGEFSSYYHICTDGNTLPWMFKDDEDFRNGINRLAICSYALNLSVFCFILMDNHVHIIVYGTLSQCKEFILRYKAAISKWIAVKYGINGYLSELSTEIIRIDSEEALMETVAYIDRNSIMAGYKCLPCDYPWGSAKYMFRDKDSYASISPLVKEISDIEVVECRSLIKSRKRIPSHWEIDKFGMIMPYCFLSLDALNNLFHSPLRYLYYLSKKLEGKIDVQQGIKSFISDKEMRIVTRNLSKEMFDTEDVRTLNFESKIILARKLRYQYASTPKQVSRMLSLDVVTLSEFI